MRCVCMLVFSHRRRCWLARKQRLLGNHGCQLCDWREDKLVRSTAHVVKKAKLVLVFLLSCSLCVRRRSSLWFATGLRGLLLWWLHCKYFVVLGNRWGIVMRGLSRYRAVQWIELNKMSLTFLDKSISSNVSSQVAFV